MHRLENMAAVVTGAHSGIGLVLARPRMTGRRKPKLGAAIHGVGHVEKGVQGIVFNVLADAAGEKL